jgi:hypothetical protein
MSSVPLIVSFDVGIKHLAYCFLDKNKEIHAWNVLNLVSEESVEPVLTCSLCTRKAVFKNESICFCKQHGVKSKDWILPVASIGSMKKQQLVDLFLAKGWSVPEGSKETVVKALQGKMLAAVRPMKKVAAGDVSLIDVGRRMVAELDRVFEGWNVDERRSGSEVMKSDCGVQRRNLGAVLIENQISPIANRMKTLQGMLTAYFLMRFPLAAVHYISSGNKLKKVAEQVGEPEEKRSYKENKELGIQRCREALQKDVGGDWLAFFDGWPGKKDDLADSYLQGVWWLSKAATKGKKKLGAVA